MQTKNYNGLLWMKEVLHIYLVKFEICLINRFPTVVMLFINDSTYKIKIKYFNYSYLYIFDINAIFVTVLYSISITDHTACDVSYGQSDVICISLHNDYITYNVLFSDDSVFVQE